MFIFRLCGGTLIALFAWKCCPKCAPSLPTVVERKPRTVPAQFLPRISSLPGFIGIKMHLGLTNAIERNKSELASWEWVARVARAIHGPCSGLGPQRILCPIRHTQIHTEQPHPCGSGDGQRVAMGQGAYVFVKLLNIMAMECHSDAPEHEETWRG